MFVGLVAAVSGGIYLIFHVDMADNVREMLNQLTSSNSNIQKLAAYELLEVAKETTPEQRIRAGIDDSRVGKKILGLFRSEEDYGPDTRRLLVLCLGYFRCQDAVPDLIRQMRLSAKESRELRIDCIFSLGLLKNSDGIPELLKAIEDEDPEIRREATVSLGRIGDRSVQSHLEKLLSDDDLTVKWGAAIALADLGSGKGSETFQSMLDRNFLDGLEGLDEIQRSGIMRRAIQAINNFRMESFKPQLQEISESDPNLRVRSEALRTLKNLP